MKLIASPHFPEKRIGYLGMMLLLSEEADVLMLATNALKNDLNSENRFVSGLALCAIGNLATADMSRDLAPEVDKHLKSSQPYLRKKACLAMARCLTKCPEMVEDFVDRVVTLLKDRSHGVLVTVIQLMTQVLIVEQQNKLMEVEEGDVDTPCQEAFTKLVPSLVKIVRSITGGGYAANDAGGTTDLFLQVHILTLLRLLGAGDSQASEEMNDILAQVATNTETAKNSGNAILYECVQTIMGVESDDTLRVLAVNILGRFLLNKDNNIRYVALNTLSKCIMEEKRVEEAGFIDESTAEEGAHSAAGALQKHRSTIVDCLKDPDISIRQRALELIYHLVNNENVESLTAELLNYLVLCPKEHKADICTRVLRVVEAYSPSDRWRVDTLITMLTIAGRESARSVQSSSIIYISRSSEDIRAYATHKLLKAIRDDDGSQQGLLIVGVWCIGEYGDLLLKHYSSQGTTDSTMNENFSANEPAAVLQTLEEVVSRHTCSQDVKERALTCFAKLSERFASSGDSDTLNRLQHLVKKNSKSNVLELQLRSCEYDALISAMKGMKPHSGNDDIFGADETGLSADIVSAAKEALARMPVVDLAVLQKHRSSEFGENGEDTMTGSLVKPHAKPKEKKGGDLLDLEDIFGGSAQPASQGNGSSNDAKAAPPPSSDLDLLSDIFSAPTSTAAAPAPSTSGTYDPFGSISTNQPQHSDTVQDVFETTTLPASTSVPISAPTSNGLDDIFSSAPVPPPSNVTIVPGGTFSGLTIDFECTKPDPMDNKKSQLLAKFSNSNNSPLHGLSLQCAVPKYITMEMKPPTSTTIPASSGSDESPVSQTIVVTNTKLGEKNVMLKLKLAFTLDGTKVEHMSTISGFPGEF
jgi:AP-1 complex subunit gamma-1